MMLLLRETRQKQAFWQAAAENIIAILGNVSVSSLPQRQGEVPFASKLEVCWGLTYVRTHLQTRVPKLCT
jgi:hypothetical protein